MMATPPAPFRVCSFESRRREEMASLIRRQGGEPTVVSSMQEVPLDDNTGVFVFAEELLSGRIDAMVFLTGVGARAMRDVVEQQYDPEAFLEALRGVTVIVRGPKPTAVLRGWNVPIAVRAPEPNTWKEVISAIDEANLSLAGRRVAVQEYGQPSEELNSALRERGASVLPVPVYCWRLPDDMLPLQMAILEGVRTGFDLILFTSAQQVRHVQQVAEEMGQRDVWLAAARRSVIASIGPTCSEALREAGLSVELEPSHPKMGTLVREAIDALPKLLAAKQSS